MKIVRQTILTLLVSSKLFAFNLGNVVNIARNAVENLSIEMDINLPILPIDLPMYPTTISLEGFESAAASGMKSYLNFSPPQSVLVVAREAMRKKLEDASKDILQPGVLTKSVDHQIKLLSSIEVLQVGLKIEASNMTQEFAATPVKLKMFLGGADLAKGFSNEVLIPFNAADGNYVVLRPGGQRQTMEVKNVPHLVQLLNNILQKRGQEVGLGYRAEYLMVDSANGADVAGEVKRFAPCMASLAAGSAGAALPGIGGFLTASLPSARAACPTPEQLLKWRFVVHQLTLSLRIKAKPGFSAPKGMSCKDFAQGQNLINLGKACEL